MFPSNSSLIRHPLPSTGSCGTVPLLPRYYQMLRLPDIPPAALRFLRLAVPRVPYRFRLSGPFARPDGPAGGFHCRWPLPASSRGDDRASQVPGEPQYEHAPLFDPGGTSGPGRSRYADVAFRVNDTVGSHKYKPFGALSRGLPTRCLRFAARVTPRPRKTRFRPSASLAGQDWLPAGFQCKV